MARMNSLSPEEDYKQAVEELGEAYGLDKKTHSKENSEYVEEEFRYALNKNKNLPDETKKVRQETTEINDLKKAAGELADAKRLKNDPDKKASFVAEKFNEAREGDKSWVDATNALKEETKQEIEKAKTPSAPAAKPNPAVDFFKSLWEGIIGFIAAIGGLLSGLFNRQGHGNQHLTPQQRQQAQHNQKVVTECAQGLLAGNSKILAADLNAHVKKLQHQKGGAANKDLINRNETAAEKLAAMTPADVQNLLNTQCKNEDGSEYKFQDGKTHTFGEALKDPKLQQEALERIVDHEAAEAKNAARQRVAEIRSGLHGVGTGVDPGNTTPPPPAVAVAGAAVGTAAAVRPR